MLKKTQQYTLPAGDPKTLPKVAAKFMLDPARATGRTLLHENQPVCKQLTLDGMVAALNELADEAAKPESQSVEKMLLGQMHLLHHVFNTAASHCLHAETLNELHVYGNLAMKAQNLCRMTAATIADIKNPQRTTFIKNTGQNQQINLGVKPEGSKKFLPEKTANELLSEGHYEAVDTRGTGAAGNVNSAMEAVEQSRRKDR